MGAIHAVGPNQCMVISGGCAGDGTRNRMIMGGWGWAWRGLSSVQRFDLTVMTVMPKCENVLSTEGVPLCVTGVAQVKIQKSADYLNRAAEQFMGKSNEQISQTILQTLEGHLRAILATLTVEEVYRDRHKFAREVRETALPDLGRMGIDIVSFTIKEIYDNVTYLAALGKKQTANVKRDAAIGVAESNRDAGIIESKCEREAADRKYEAQTNIADYKRALNTKEEEFKVQVSTKTAEAVLAYKLQQSKTSQLLRAEELLVDVVERRKQIGVEDKEIIRKEKELMALIQLPAVAEAFKIEQLAEGMRRQRVAIAKGEADKIKLVGEARASAINAVGCAEAEGMRLKADAYKGYEEAAIISLLLKYLPTIAAEVCAPLTKVDKILMIGDDKASAEVAKLLGQLPPTVEALTGVDLSQIMAQIPGARKSAS